MPQSYGQISGELKEMLPLGSRVLIRPHKQDTRYVGNLIIPQSASKVPTTGTVVALGFALQDDIRREEGNGFGCPLREGDQVAYTQYGGIQFRMDDGKDLLVVHIDDIVAILKGNISIEEKTDA